MARKYMDIRKVLPKHPTRKWKTRTSADTIIVHTTASSQQDPAKVAANHIRPGKDNHLSQAGAPGLAYHDFITTDGVVYHCNNYTDVTWHAKLWNTRSVGVVMAFRGQDGRPPEVAQYDALKRHLVVLCLYMKILPERVFGHRECPWMSTVLGNGSVRYKKECPGMGVNLDQLRDSVTRKLQERLQEERLYTGRIDGAFGPASRKALLAFDPLRSSTRLINWRY
jgi:N-acetyl-anhydromuramyl-L-alanine amidase AmpD